MSHKITLQGDERVFWVEANESVLDAALRSGIHLPYGCRGGTCGACRVRLISGEIDYPEEPTAIGPRERAAGQALMCQAHPLSDLTLDLGETGRVGGIEVKSLPSRVIATHQLADDVMRIYLKLPATESLRYLAGQYIDIILRDGRRRSFSIANAPHIGDYLELHVRKVPGGEFTGFVFDGLKEKAIIRIQGPLGSFFLRDDSQLPLIVMAGGTGFAPIKAILEDAFHKGISRPIHFYWGARARQDLYQNDLPDGWAEQHQNFVYTPVLSEPTEADNWQGRSGWVHQAVAADYPKLDRHQIYMSGPPPMIEAAKSAFFAQGMNAEQLFYDAFDYGLDRQ